VLTHPVWWTEETHSPKERVIQVINGRARNIKESYLRQARMVIETTSYTNISHG